MHINCTWTCSADSALVNGHTYTFVYVYKIRNFGKYHRNILHCFFTIEVNYVMYTILQRYLRINIVTDAVRRFAGLSMTLNRIFSSWNLSLYCSVCVMCQIFVSSYFWSPFTFIVDHLWIGSTISFDICQIVRNIYNNLIIKWELSSSINVFYICGDPQG